MVHIDFGMDPSLFFSFSYFWSEMEISEDEMFPGKNQIYTELSAAYNKKILCSRLLHNYPDTISVSSSPG